MDRALELSRFLSSRRAKLAPSAEVFPDASIRRRVAGLRREEVAELSGISVAYYTKLERGQVAGVSPSVFCGLCDALRLDPAERDYLAALLSVAAPPVVVPSPSSSDLARLQRLLDAMGNVPAYIRNHRFDILAANRVGAELYAPVLRQSTRPPNTARFLFLDPAAHLFFMDWAEVTAHAGAWLRAALAATPCDGRLEALIAELHSGSSEFRRIWAEQRVGVHQSGTKRLHHPAVGDLTLEYQSFEVAGAAKLRLNTYAAAEGSTSAQHLLLLQSICRRGIPITGAA